MLYDELRRDISPTAVNRNEGNDQESIQLPYTCRLRHRREKKDAIKATAPQSKPYKQKAKKDSFFLKKIGQTAIQNKNFTKTYMQRHTMTEIVNHSRSNALERSVKPLLESLNYLVSNCTRPQPSPLVLPWCTQDICSEQKSQKVSKIVLLTLFIWNQYS